MNSIPVTIRFTSDWGVGTGVGYAGGVDSVVEVDENNQPVVRGTVITGVIREQALTVARALDGGQSGRWHAFIGSLFGGAPNLGDADEDETVPRAVIFSDARICEEAKAADDAGTAKVTEAVSVSIDEKTGAAKPDHFRIIERAPACVLKGRVDFVDSDTWNEDQVESAKFVLALAGTLVPAIGSEKTNGDGRCEITVGFPDDVGGGCSANSDEGETAGSGEDGSSDSGADQSPSSVDGQAEAAHAACKEWLQEKLGSLTKAPASVHVGAPGEPPCVASAEDTDPSKQTDQHKQAESKRKPDRQRADGRADSPSYRSFDLNIKLKTPVVSYEAPMSNEVRSLDFLRGTVMLAWAHSRLCAEFPKDTRIRNAVVNGDLFVSDATACVAGVRGRPVPMVFSYPKVPGERPDGSSADDEPSTGQSTNSAGEPCRVKGEPGSPGDGPDMQASETAPSTRELWNRLISKEPEKVHVPVRSGYIFDFGDGEPGKPRYGTGAPPVTGRQSTAHDAVRGTAKDGQLFLVRALAAGLTLQSEVTITESLYKHRPTVTKNLCEHLPGEAQNETQQVSQRTLGEMLPEILHGQARLGSRRLTGTFGLAECETTEKPTSDRAAAGGDADAGGNGADAGGNAASGNGSVADVRANLDDNANTGNADAWDSEGATTIWFTSDLLLRSRSLGAAGSSKDIIDAFNRSKAFSDTEACIKLFLPENSGKKDTTASKQDANNGMTPPKQNGGENDHRYRAGLRYRRVDSWSAAEGQPRATRLAVQAGSVLKVRLGDNAEQRRKALAALRELETVGIGELRAQGFGRFVVGDPLLSIGDNDGKKLHVQLLHSNDFLSDEK